MHSLSKAVHNTNYGYKYKLSQKTFMGNLGVNGWALTIDYRCDDEK
jgi:hypothetical protein